MSKPKEPDGWQYDYVTCVSSHNWQHFVNQDRQNAEVQAWSGRFGNGPAFVRPVYYGEPIELTEPPEHNCAGYVSAVRGLCRICGVHVERNLVSREN